MQRGRRVAGRRQILRGVTGAALLSGSTSGISLAAAKSEAEVTPGEDLMQEHGVLRRVFGIYDEVVHRLGSGVTFEPAVVTEAAGLVRRFIEDYHERTEEQFVFPRLEKAKKEVALVGILRQQHQKGRELTDAIRRHAEDKTPLADAMQAFTHMYRAHAAREDTVLFPAFRELMGNAAYRELGEQFEEQEHKLVGKHGFEDAVDTVAKLEAKLGLADLAKFTPA